MTETAAWAATADPPAPHRALSPYQQLLLACLYHHRLLTTRQAHALLLERAGDYRGVQRRLHQMRAAGLVDHVTVAGTPRLLAWFTTPAGAEAVEAAAVVPARPYRITAQLAAGPLQQHTLALNEAGIAFVRHAARRAAQGYECGPLDWTPEVAHRLTDQPSGPSLIADAVVRCVVPRAGDGTRLLSRCFIEMDRAMMSVERLAEKVTAYARYYGYRPGSSQAGRATSGARPAWQYLYPAFPKIMIVLARGRAVSLTARLQDLGMLVARAAHEGRLPEQLTVIACTLDDLIEHGPYAPIHTSLTTGETGVQVFGAPRPRR